MPLRPKEEIQEIKVPFLGVPTARSTATKDQRYVNVILDVIENPTSGGARVFVFKRPGLANHTQPSAGAATGRGIYHWAATGKIYSVLNNKIYADTTDLGVTLDASSGRVWFADTPATAATQYLAVSDGTKLYLIKTDDTVTTVSTVSDAQFPSPNLGPVLFFDSYIILAKSDGTIWNSDADAPTAWQSGAFLSSEMFGDDLVSLHRQKNQIIGFGKDATEFFFNNDNATNSPLLRLDQNALQVGMASATTLAFDGTMCLWVAHETNGHYTVWKIDGLREMQRVSTPAIERILSGEAATMSSTSAFLIRTQGHGLYVLNLPTSNRTLVLDVDNNLWYEWEVAAGSGEFNIVAATEKNGVVYMLDGTNGRIYTFSPTTYQDSGTNFTVTIQTSDYDHDTSNRKFCSALDVYGDNTTGNLAVSYSDDDYTNYSTARNIDMSLRWKRLTRLGSFISRSWKLTFTANAALRLEGMRLRIVRGMS